MDGAKIKISRVFTEGFTERGSEDYISEYRSLKTCPKVLKFSHRYIGSLVNNSSLVYYIQILIINHRYSTNTWNTPREVSGIKEHLK